MPKKKGSTGFKTKSKKNKKTRRPKSKKCKGEKEKAAKKLELGLKDICSSLTGLQVDGTTSHHSALLSNEIYMDSRKNFKKDIKKQKSSRKVESNISKLFQRLSCGNEFPDSKASVPQPPSKFNFCYIIDAEVKFCLKTRTPIFVCLLMLKDNIIIILGDIKPTIKASESDINDEAYAKYARSTLSVDIVPSRKLATELPPSGKGASFILNHLENEKSYRGRIAKKDFAYTRHKRSKKNKGKGKTVLFLDECGIFV